MIEVYSWRPIPPRGLRVTVSADYDKTAYVYWGDNTGRSNPIQPGKSHTNTYAEVGTYRIRVLSPYGDVLGDESVTLRPAISPLFAFAQGPETNWLVEVRFFAEEDDLPLARFRIDWRDGKPDSVRDYWAVPGTTARRPIPLSAGVDHHTVIVRDLVSKQGYPVSIPLTLPSYDPDFTLTADGSDPTGRSVVLTATDAGGRELDAYWGDASVATRLTSGQARHTFHEVGTYLVQLADVSGGATAGKSVTIPIEEGSS
ncbi:hypothetical protein [Actinopolyspora erythraea]|nr:hypothetical protein [Actinopolyspora erythraea]